MTTTPEAHTSLWRQGLTPSPFMPYKQTSESYDVAVVGAGITGVMTAWLLAQAGKRVALLELHDIGSGDTGNTTSHLTCLTDVGYSTLRQRFGDEGAQAVYASQHAATDLMEAISRKQGIDCDFLRVPAYMYSDDASDVDHIEEECASIQAIGQDARLVAETPLPFPTVAAFRLADQAQFNPMPLIAQLAERISQTRGCVVHTHTRVHGVASGTPCVVDTEHGELKAADVVLATHAPINRFVLQTKIYPYRSYVWGVRGGPMPKPGLYFDCADPYHYIRTHPTPQGEVLIVGGADHKTGKNENTEDHYADLKAFVQKRFPQATKFDYAWSGQVLETADGLPLIGHNGADEHVWVATGFSGTGTTFGTVAAMVLSDVVCGKVNPWAKLYDTRRFKPLASAPRFVKENLDVSKHFIGDRLMPKEDIAALKPGQGALVKEDGKVLAVYRDETGECHTVSAVCPHLGCYVKWNSAEKSWDCPCHGSRFTCEGELVNGPAVSNLQVL